MFQKHSVHKVNRIGMLYGSGLLLSKDGNEFFSQAARIKENNAWFCLNKRKTFEKAPIKTFWLGYKSS